MPIFSDFWDTLSRADWVLQPWYVYHPKRKKTVD